MRIACLAVANPLLCSSSEQEAGSCWAPREEAVAMTNHINIDGVEWLRWQSSPSPLQLQWPDSGCPPWLYAGHSTHTTVKMAVRTFMAPRAHGYNMVRWVGLWVQLQNGMRSEAMILPITIVESVS